MTATATEPLEPGTRLVVYPYCISIVILTFKRSSGVRVIRPGAHRVVPGLPYLVVSLVAGWWGIPWGPIYTAQSIWRVLRGGIDVTDALVAAAAASSTPPPQPGDAQPLPWERR